MRYAIDARGRVLTERYVSRCGLGVVPIFAPAIRAGTEAALAQRAVLTPVQPTLSPLVSPLQPVQPQVRRADTNHQACLDSLAESCNAVETVQQIQDPSDPNCTTVQCCSTEIVQEFGKPVASQTCRDKGTCCQQSQQQARAGTRQTVFASR